MRIIKYFDNDKESIIAMNIFDSIIASVYYPWQLDRIEVFISDSSRCDVFLENNIARIFISKKNKFIQERDKKGIEILILYKLYSLILKLHGYDYSRIDVHIEREKKILSCIEDFLVSRKLARNFFDLIFYKKFHELSSITVDNFFNWFKANLSWLVFYKIDNYYEQYLKDMAKMKTPSHFQISCDIFNFIKKLINIGKEFEIESVRQIILELRRININF